MQIFALINEIPAASQKYQFAMAMAERIVDENTENGDEAVQEINRTALSTAFLRTTNLLYNSINGMRHVRQYSNNNATWPSFVFHALPLGGHLISYLKGILGSTFSSPADSETWRSGEEECVLAEKLTQELAWMVKKMRACSIVEEAIRQWSSASDLASLSIFANPRVQGPIVKITGETSKTLVIMSASVFALN